MRRTEGAGLVELNNLLKKVLDSLQMDQNFWPFFAPVPVAGKMGITDYLEYAPLS